MFTVTGTGGFVRVLEVRLFCTYQIRHTLFAHTRTRRAHYLCPYNTDTLLFGKKDNSLTRKNKHAFPPLPPALVREAWRTPPPRRRGVTHRLRAPRFPPASAERWFPDAPATVRVPRDRTEIADNANCPDSSQTHAESKKGSASKQALHVATCTRLVCHLSDLVP